MSDASPFSGFRQLFSRNGALRSSGSGHEHEHELELELSKESAPQAEPSARSSVFASCADAVSTVVSALFRAVDDAGAYAEPPSDNNTTRRAKLLYVALLESVQRQRGEWQGFAAEDDPAADSQPVLRPGELLTASVADVEDPTERLCLLNDLIAVSFRNLRSPLVPYDLYTEHRARLAAESLTAPPPLAALAAIRALVDGLELPAKLCLFRLLSLWEIMALVNPDGFPLTKTIEGQHHHIFSDASEFDCLVCDPSPHLHPNEFSFECTQTGRNVGRSDAVAMDLLLVMTLYRDVIFSDIEVSCMPPKKGHLSFLVLTIGTTIHAQFIVIKQEMQAQQKYIQGPRDTFAADVATEATSPQDLSQKRQSNPRIEDPGIHSRNSFTRATSLIADTMDELLTDGAELSDFVDTNTRPASPDATCSQSSIEDPFHAVHLDDEDFSSTTSVSPSSTNESSEQRRLRPGRLRRPVVSLLMARRKVNRTRNARVADSPDSEVDTELQPSSSAKQPSSRRRRKLTPIQTQDEGALARKSSREELKRTNPASADDNVPNKSDKPRIVRDPVRVAPSAPSFIALAKSYFTLPVAAATLCAVAAVMLVAMPKMRRA